MIYNALGLQRDTTDAMTSLSAEPNFANSLDYPLRLIALSEGAIEASRT